MKKIIIPVILFLSLVSFIKTDTYVSPFTVGRSVNYKDFSFSWVGVGDLNHIDLRYSFDAVNYTTFYSTNNINSSYSTRFNFKSNTFFKATGVSLTGQEYDSGIIELRVGHGNYP